MFYENVGQQQKGYNPVDFAPSFFNVPQNLQGFVLIKLHLGSNNTLWLWEPLCMFLYETQ